MPNCEKRGYINVLTDTGEVKILSLSVKQMEKLKALASLKHLPWYRRLLNWFLRFWK